MVSYNKRPRAQKSADHHGIAVHSLPTKSRPRWARWRKMESPPLTTRPSQRMTRWKFDDDYAGKGTLVTHRHILSRPESFNMHQRCEIDRRACIRPSCWRYDWSFWSEATVVAARRLTAYKMLMCKWGVLSHGWALWWKDEATWGIVRFSVPSNVRVCSENC